MLGPVGLPGVGVGRVADGVVAVTQLDGPIVVGGAEVGEELAAIGRRCAALPVLDTRAADTILGYDERGLPA
ncbi:antitoxin [Mycobacterium tuberculosis]|nr:antitoxin [Mycobacterium tuberculosis]